MKMINKQQLPSIESLIELQQGITPEIKFRRKVAKELQVKKGRDELRISYDLGLSTDFGSESTWKVGKLFPIIVPPHHHQKSAFYLTAAIRNNKLLIEKADIPVKNPEIIVTDQMLEKLKTDYEKFFANKKERKLGFSISDPFDGEKLKIPKEDDLEKEHYDSIWSQWAKRHHQLNNQKKVSSWDEIFEIYKEHPKPLIQNENTFMNFLKEKFPKGIIIQS